MLYLIDNKYYVKLYPNYYGEVKLSLNGDDVVIVPTEHRLSVTEKKKVTTINFQQEKNNLIKLLSKNNKSNEHDKTTSKRSRYNYFE